MALEGEVRKILSRVQDSGLEAVRRYSAKFDDYEGELTPSAEEWDNAENIPTEDREAIDRIIERVKDHHSWQYPGDSLYNKEGSLYGFVYRPIERVGLYVPGGNPLPSSLIMQAVPAKVAGVDHITVTSPPDGGAISPHMLYVARELEVDSVYKVGGVQAIGAMAFGAGMEAVDKIFGPGNRYVNEAKRQVFGEVGIDALAGPSEICIVADEGADPTTVQADLRAQLEHGSDSRAWLLTTSKEITEIVDMSEVDVRLKSSLVKCIETSNELAPEHLELLVDSPWELLGYVRNAGAVYLGQYSPASAGDYSMGVNHVLPTGGAARYSSVLSVRDFLKEISVAEVGKREYSRISPLGKKMAQIEGMDLHKNSMEVREDETTNE